MLANHKVKVLGIGVAAVSLTVGLFDWIFRRLWQRSRSHLKEVLFFPTPLTCVEHLFKPLANPCPCPLPHGVETSLSILVRRLLSTSKSLDLCIFSFSNQQLSRAVLTLKNRGVVVRILVDKDYMQIQGSQISFLLKAGICVRHSWECTYMHHKFAVADGRLLITGSLNWTTTAIHNNNENILVTEDPELVEPFVEEFQKLWDANNPALHQNTCRRDPAPIFQNGCV